MQTLNSLLDNARKMCGRDSDRALAQRLKVTGTTVMEWRRGNRRITDEHLAALIALAQADPALAVKVREEGAETKAERALWGPLWDRLSPVTSTVVGALLLVGLWAPSPAQAATKLNDGHAIHYAKYAQRLRRVWHALRKALATLNHRPGAVDEAPPVLA